jgi:N-acetylmuramoyl-L-alanine amidase
MITSTFKHNLRVVIIALLCATIVISSCAFAWYKIKNKNDTPANNSSVSSSQPNTEPTPAEKQLLDSFRSISVAPKVDFLTEDRVTVDDVKNEIDAIISNIASDGFDTVEVTLNYGSNLLFTVDGFMCDYDVFEYFASAARRNGLKLISVIDLKDLTEQSIVSSDGIAKINSVLSSKMIGNYSDMLILKNCYITAADVEYLYAISDTNLTITEFAVEQLYGAVKSFYLSAANSKPTMGIGVEINRINMPDGYIQDVKTWSKDGICDFAVLYNPYSTANDDLSFVTYYETVRSELELEYSELSCRLAYNLIGSGEKGWEQTDQILSQLQNLDTLGVNFVLQSYKVYVGDKTESRNVVKKFLAHLFTDDYIVKELSISKPEKQTFTTSENMVNLAGASDPEFALTLNGEPLERSELGLFSTDLTLKDGLNTFKIEHKGVTKEYKITYKRTIIKSVSPTKKTSLPSRSILIVSCVAISGSNVTVSLGDISATLTEEVILDDNGNPAGEYSNFNGEITLPIVYDEDAALGKITFKAVSKYGTETKKSGNIVVIKEDRPLPPSSTPTTPPSTPSTSTPDGPSVDILSIYGSANAPKGGTAWTMPSGSGYVNVGTKYISQITSDTVQTFESNDKSNYSRPTNNYLPKGTVDYCSSTSKYIDSTTSLRAQRFGKSLYEIQSGKEKINVFKGVLPDHQSIGVAGFSTGTRHSTLTLDTLWKAPFKLDFTPQSYVNSSLGENRDYTLKNGATFKYIDITFCYTTLVEGDVQIPADHPTFSKAEWIKNAGDYTLRLHLKKTGVFYGWSAEYNSQGQLVFSFLNPAKITAANNSYGYRLDGTVIVIDVGHGGKDPGALGGNSKYTEAVLNLTLAKMVKKELESLGATVVMTRDTNVYLDALERKTIVRQTKPDFMLAIHRNSNDSSLPRGFQSFYYNAYSYNAAKAVYDKTVVANLYESSKWTKLTAHKYFYTCRTSECPTVLTENGFMSNADEYSDMIKDDFNQKCAVALTEGIVAYFASIQ